MNNVLIGSIERVGNEFILCSKDISDPQFFGGKRIFHDFDALTEFVNHYIHHERNSSNSTGHSQCSPKKSNGNGKSNGASTDAISEEPCASEIYEEVSKLLGYNPEQRVPTPPTNPSPPVFESREVISLSDNC